MALIHSRLLHSLSYRLEFRRGKRQMEQEFPLGDGQVDFPFLLFPSLSDPDDDTFNIRIVSRRRKPGSRVFILTYFFESKLNLFWLSFFMIFPAIFFVLRAFNTVLNKLLLEGLAPMILPLGKWVLALYLLFTAKGVISGAGFIFLVASFVCRYYNVLYA